MTAAAPVDIPVDQLQPYDLVRVSSEARLPEGWPAESVQATPQFQLLHRPKPKPPIGTVLTGKQVKARQWKRGTKFCYIERGDLNHPPARFTRAAPLYSVIELTRDGDFIRLGNDSNPLEYIGDEAKFILVYRPEEESDSRYER